MCEVSRLADEAFLVVGLGNPGPEYAATRHNFGFMLLDRLLAAGEPDGSFEIAAGLPVATARLQLDGHPVCLAKPLTYMNRSGLAVAGLLAKSPGLMPERLLVVHDDLDLPLGRIKLRAGGGSGGHRGIASVIDQLGRADFFRLRLGIDSELRGDDTVDFVLSPFAETELGRVDAVLERGVKGIGLLLASGSAAAMNEINRPQPEVEEKKLQVPDPSAGKTAGPD